MANWGPTEMLQAVLVRLEMATIAAIVLSWCWLIWRLLTRQRILPEQPLVARREIPWNVGTILLVFLLYVAVNLFFALSYPLVAAILPAKIPAVSLIGKEQAAGDLKTKTESERSAPLKDGASVATAGKVDPSQPPAGAGAKVTVDPEKRPAVVGPVDENKVPLSHMMLLNGLGEVALLLLIPVVVKRTSGGTLRDLGLSFEDWPRQAAHGVIATLIATLPIYTIQYAAAKIWTPSEHPLSKMITQEFSFGVGCLAIVTAVVLAPMFEELVFRGLLQSWLVALLDRRARLGPPSSQPEIVYLDPTEKTLDAEYWESEPELLSLPHAPQSSDSVRVEPPARAWLAIVLTSLLFAYVHAPQWPAPIALFALALVIGTVYRRSGSLITAIFMHATFNGISTLMLFLAVLSSHKSLPDQVVEPAAQNRRTTSEIGESSPVAASWLVIRVEK